MKDERPYFGALVINWTDRTVAIHGLNDEEELTAAQALRIAETAEAVADQDSIYLVWWSDVHLLAGWDRAGFERAAADYLRPDPPGTPAPRVPSPYTSAKRPAVAPAPRLVIRTCGGLVEHVLADRDPGVQVLLDVEPGTPEHDYSAVRVEVHPETIEATYRGAGACATSTPPSAG